MRWWVGRCYSSCWNFSVTIMATINYWHLLFGLLVSTSCRLWIRMATQWHMKVEFDFLDVLAVFFSDGNWFINWWLSLVCFYAWQVGKKLNDFIFQMKNSFLHIFCIKKCITKIDVKMKEVLVWMKEVQVWMQRIGGGGDLKTLCCIEWFVSLN